MSTVASSNSDLTINADGTGNDIKLQSNGTQVARLTAEGTLGVGTDAAPTSNLQIHEDSTGHCTIDITNTTTTNAALKGLKIGRGSDGAGGHGILLNYEDNKDWVFSTSIGSNNAIEKVRISADGAVAIGTAAPASGYKLDVNGKAVVRDDFGLWNDYCIQYWKKANGTDRLGWILNRTDNTCQYAWADGQPLIFCTTTTGGTTSEKMRLTSDGRLGVGTASLSNKFQVEEDSSSNWVASYHDSRTDGHSSAGMIVFSRTSSYTGVGSITTSESSTAFNTSSDYRLKENLVGLDGALDRLAQLKTYRFNFKADPNTTVDGFVAHEVADVVPEAVTGEKDEMETVQLPVEGGEAGETEEVERIKPQGIDQSKLVPLLVAAVQELSAKVSSLEEQLNAS